MIDNDNDGSEGEFGIAGHERSSDSSLIVKRLDLWQTLYMLSNPDYTLEVGCVVSVQLLKVVGCFRYLEVSQSQVSQDCIFVPNKVVQLFHLYLHLAVIQPSFLSVMVGRVKHVQTGIVHIL